MICGVATFQSPFPSVFDMPRTESIEDESAQQGLTLHTSSSHARLTFIEGR